MRGAHPDTTGLEAIRNQPEFHLQLDTISTLAVRTSQRKVGMQPVDS
jgi:hypothetical protein